MTKATEHALSKEFFSEHCWLTCVLILAKTFTDHIGLHVVKTNCPVTVLQEGGPLPGPETRLLSNTQKWIVRGDTCADKARDFIGKGTRVENRRVREPRRTSLPRGSKSRVLWCWDLFPGGLWPIILFFFFICSEFCHTLEWNSHGFTCVPHPDPPSHLPLHPLPLGFPSAPGPSACLMHLTWAGDLLQPRYHTCFNAVLLKHPTLSFSHRV